MILQDWSILIHPTIAVLTLKDWIILIHPAIAVLLVFPLIGTVVNFAIQTRQRRLETASGNKSKIPATAGREHVLMGKYLSASVVGIILIAFADAIFIKQPGNTGSFYPPFQAAFLVLMFVMTIASLVLLFQAQAKHWRATFATLTSMGLIILGSQEGVFRRTYEWQVSHYYYGMVAALLMIISLAVVEEIYRDKSLTWRRLHIGLNSFAFLLFIGQGITGVRDIFEIALFKEPPGWIFLPGLW